MSNRRIDPAVLSGATAPVAIGHALQEGFDVLSAEPTPQHWLAYADLLAAASAIPGAGDTVYAYACQWSVLRPAPDYPFPGAATASALKNLLVERGELPADVLPTEDEG